MTLFVRLFVIALISLAVTMLYSQYINAIDVLEQGRITSKSRYEDKIVTAPTRRVKQGWREFWQVSTPNGTWYECRNGDCAETLRIEYVDHAFKHLYAPEPGSSSPYQNSN